MMCLRCPYCGKEFPYNINGYANKVLAEERLKKHISISHVLEK